MPWWYRSQGWDRVDDDGGDANGGGAGGDKKTKCGGDKYELSKSSSTTALAFKYIDMHTQRPALCLAADSRLVDINNRTVCNDFQKIFVVSRTVLFVFSGQSDIATTSVVNSLRAEVQQYGYNNYTFQNALDLVTSLVRHLSPKDKFNVILAGYEERKKDYLIAFVDKAGQSHGISSEYDMLCIGSGGRKAYEFLQKHRWKDCTSSHGAVQIASRAIGYSASEDEATGGTLTVYISGGYFEGLIIHSAVVCMEDLPTYLRENGLPPQRQD